MKTVAFVLLDTPKVFQFIGHQPLAFWVIEKLQEVRGIDKIICAVRHDLLTEATKTFNKFDVECLGIPKDLKPSSSKYNVWHAEQVSAYDVAVTLKPTTPFLPTSKIEKCVNLVVKHKATQVSPVRRRGRCEEAMAMTVNHTSKKAAGIVTVPVSLIESLDADDPDEYVLISALVESGKV